MAEDQKEVMYSGMIAERTYGEDDFALFIGDDPYEPFAKRFQEDLELYGRNISVSYFITDEPRSADDLANNLIKVMAGAADADYSQHYSDITGYLWTDAECMVGGHDLLGELESYVGKYCHMTVIFTQGGSGV